MFLSATGVVQEVKRNVKGSMSIVTLRQPYSGQTVTDGKWGLKETGFFQYRVWENNLMTGANTNFVKFLDTLKPGATVEVLAEGTMIKRVQDGKTINSNIELTAHKFTYIGTKQQDDTTRVMAAGTDPGSDDPSPAEEEGFIDPLDQW